MFIHVKLTECILKNVSLTQCIVSYILVSSGWQTLIIVKERVRQPLLWITSPPPHRRFSICHFLTWGNRRWFSLIQRHFKTMPLQQSETWFSALSDGALWVWCYESRLLEALPRTPCVMKWDRVAGLSAVSQIFSCFMSRCLSQQRGRGSVIFMKRTVCPCKWSVSYEKKKKKRILIPAHCLHTGWLMSAGSEKFGMIKTPDNPFLTELKIICPLLLIERPKRTDCFKVVKLEMQDT